MRPGATSAVLRWRLGAWLVGTGLLLLVLDLIFLHKGVGFWCLCLFLMIMGALIANPLRVMGRLREGGPADPVVRLRPLGIIGFIVMMVLFLVPFAIGEWLLNMVGELFERRSGRRVIDLDDDDPAAGRRGDPRRPPARAVARRRRLRGHLLRRAGSESPPHAAAAHASLIRQIAWPTATV